MIDEDLRQERVEWQVQRLAWALLALLVVAGASGLLGSGPLAVVREDAGGLSVTHPRISRRGAAEELELRLDAAAGDGAVASLWIGGSWSERQLIETILPPPVATRLQPDGVRFDFPRPEQGPLVVRFRVRPLRAGSLAADLRVDGGPSLAFTQFVLP